MERIQSLINRLQEELDQNAGPGKMLITVSMIQSELAQFANSGNKKLGTSKVAVILPMPARIETPAVQQVKQSDTEQTVQSAPKPQPKPKPKNQLDFHFDPMQEIPTLSQHQNKKEVNDSVEKGESLNDRLKEKSAELMSTLKHEPIRDLRKAISVNDRFVFLQELFRGDEAMFDRSLKTINSFNIYAEAEYWMNRELKVKLGWDEKNELVAEFYQLVKRRFS